MKIVILGGGLTGLTAAYYLSETHKDITIIEREGKLGGLASGFKKSLWGWALERTYHHIFSNDSAILELSQRLQFEGFIFSTPTTASLFGGIHNYRIFPVDSPKDFLLLPEISLFAKLRAGFTVVFLKIAPFFSWYEKVSSAVFLKKTMGEEVWEKLWEQLFRKKYGKYAEKILTSFIWARIHKRTQKLGYPKGGFQAFIDTLATVILQRKISINTSCSVYSVKKEGKNYEVEVKDKEGNIKKYEADVILSTLPYPISCNVMKGVLEGKYISEQSKRKYLYAINLILKTKKPILKNTYWLNVGAKDIPIMCIVQHTNFISSKEYGGDELCYVAWYVEEGSDLLKKNEKEMLDFVFPHLKNINPQLIDTPEVVGLFKAPYAQPIFDEEFVSIPRLFTTPAQNVFIANMDMTYPYDRGTNYAVQLGRDVSNFILKNHEHKNSGD